MCLTNELSDSELCKNKLIKELNEVRLLLAVENKNGLHDDPAIVVSTNSEIDTNKG